MKKRKNIFIYLLLFTILVSGNGFVFYKCICHIHEHISHSEKHACCQEKSNCCSHETDDNNFFPVKSHSKTKECNHEITYFKVPLYGIDFLKFNFSIFDFSIPFEASYNWTQNSISNNLISYSYFPPERSFSDIYLLKSSLRL